ncbi:hypothetical protein HDU79_002024 [Rhizoclosmatium sp. JEL0117]|nr:hypothetical protein HDU79_002024 [Rhizoclosmatium sp. JEL0117]
MATQSPAAIIYFQDAQCSVPGYISYVYNETGANCSSADINDCQPFPGMTNWWGKTLCVSDIKAFGNSIFGSNTVQLQLLQTGPGCKSRPTAGQQFALNQCTLVKPGSLSTAVSTKVIIDPSTTKVFWTTYSDPNCQTYLDAYPIPNSPDIFCLSNQYSSTILNYSKKLSLKTIYSSDSCKSPARISYDSVSSCSPSTQCTSSNTTEYSTTECTSVYDFPKLSQQAFPGPYFIYQPYLDAKCATPLPQQAIALNTCFGVILASGVTRFLNATTVDEKSVLMQWYDATGCLGDPVSVDFFSGDGECVPGKGKVFYSGLGDVGVVSTSVGSVGNAMNSTDSGGNGVPVGIIVGGVFGGLFLLAVILFVVCCCAARRLEEEVKGGSDFALDSAEPKRSFTILPASMTIRNARTMLRRTTVFRFPFLNGTLSTTASAPRYSMATATILSSDEPDFMTSRGVTTRVTEKESQGVDMFRTMNTLQSSSTAFTSKESAGVSNRASECTMFGELLLPVLPSDWTVEHVSEWVVGNDGTYEMLEYIHEHGIDGRALLLLNVDDFSFPTKGRRIRFQDALDNLRTLQTTHSAQTDPSLSLPSYS